MRPVELDGTPDLVELASAARDAGHEVTLVERPMPDAVSLVGIGRRYDCVSVCDSDSRPPISIACTAPSWLTRTTLELVTKFTPAATAELCSASTIFCHPSSM